MQEYRFLKELPEGYECKDITDQFVFQHIAWRRKTKKQRMKFKGLYGIAYTGASQVTTGLLRLIAKHIFYEKHGFIVLWRTQYNSLEYVKV